MIIVHRTKRSVSVSGRRNNTQLDTFISNVTSLNSKSIIVDRTETIKTHSHRAECCVGFSSGNLFMRSCDYKMPPHAVYTSILQVFTNALQIPPSILEVIHFLSRIMYRFFSTVTSTLWWKSVIEHFCCLQNVALVQTRSSPRRTRIFSGPCVHFVFRYSAFFIIYNYHNTFITLLVHSYSVQNYVPTWTTLTTLYIN